MSITKEVKASDATAQKMFSKGTLVEVSSWKGQVPCPVPEPED